MHGNVVRWRCGIHPNGGVGDGGECGGGGAYGVGLVRTGVVRCEWSVLP